jgi:hypothetical protein
MYWTSGSHGGYYIDFLVVTPYISPPSSGSKRKAPASAVFLTYSSTLKMEAIFSFRPYPNFAGSIPDKFIEFFNLSKSSSRTMALGSTQFLTEMSTRNLTGGKGRPACKADNLTAVCDPIV